MSEFPLMLAAARKMEGEIQKRLSKVGVRPETLALRSSQLERIQEGIKLLEGNQARELVDRGLHRFMAFVAVCDLQLPKDHERLPAYCRELELIGFSEIGVAPYGMFEQPVTGQDFL